MSLERLAELAKLFEKPDYERFRSEFDALRNGTAALPASQANELSAIGAAAFQKFLEASPDPEMGTLRWFTRLCSEGVIKENGAIERALLRLERRLKREDERRRHGAFDASTNILQTKRVVQLSWFGSAGFSASDAFEIRRSVYSGRQERTFVAAAALRFPGLTVLPNYPLRQVVDLDKIKRLLPAPLIHYGFKCLIDVLLVTPREGDPIAAFELDSQYHDDKIRQRQDQWKDQLLRAASIPLFRIRSEDPNATSVDEWYSILTDQVLDRIDCGSRIRTRDSHETLVPIVR